MTILETIQTIRMILDDTRDYYFVDIVAAVNEAQHRLIDKYYRLGHMRALRPLLEESDYEYEDGDTITPKLYYPLGGRILPDTLNDFSVENTMYMRYLDNRDFQRSLGSISPGLPYPNSVFYSIQWEYVSDMFETKIRLSRQRNNVPKAKLYYVKYPTDVAFNANTGGGTAISLSPEFHFEVCTKAATILSDIDVLEQERENPNPGQGSISIEDASGIEATGNQGARR